MDTILFWNEVALEANRVSHTDGKDTGTLGPTLSTRALAIVHLAMYDAYAGAVKDPANLPPYLTNLPTPAAGASPVAAVAAAAHATLSQLHPSQKTFFDLKKSQADEESHGLGFGDGQAFGLIVAQRILDDRKNDPDAKDTGYTPSPARGAHRPDPNNPDQGFHAPFYGAKSKCFAVTARHQLEAPPRPGGPEYRQALKEVRGKGIAPELMGTLLPTSLLPRTVDEALIGIYWAYDGVAGIGTPPRLYNQIVRTLAIARNNSVAENARLFALVNVAMADAGILAWDQKYLHDFWRPVVAIREHDKSMGPAATLGSNDILNDCDPLWLPLGSPKSNAVAKNFTPPFPAYPSGHATFGAAAFHITRLFYGVANFGPDNLFDGLTFVSDEWNGHNKDNAGAVRPRHVRSFPGGLWQMIEENCRSRVYLGVHWLFDSFAIDDNDRPNLSRNIGGMPLGLKIAEDVFNGGRPKGLKKSNVGPRT